MMSVRLSNISLFTASVDLSFFGFDGSRLAALRRGRAAAMTEKEYEQQQRDLVRVISVCTLGLWSFAAGLLIGTFILF